MNEILNWLGAGGGLAAISKGTYDYYKARSDARKIGADAAQVLVQTAAESNKDLAADVKEMRAELRDVASWRRRHEELLIEHSRWDHRIVEQLRGLTETHIPDPPPLYLEGT